MYCQNQQWHIAILVHSNHLSPFFLAPCIALCHSPVLEGSHFLKPSAHSSGLQLAVKLPQVGWALSLCPLTPLVSGPTHWLPEGGQRGLQKPTDDTLSPSECHRPGMSPSLAHKSLTALPRLPPEEAWRHMATLFPFPGLGARLTVTTISLHRSPLTLTAVTWIHFTWGSC